MTGCAKGATIFTDNSFRDCLAEAAKRNHDRGVLSNESWLWNFEASQRQCKLTRGWRWRGKRRPLAGKAGVSLGGITWWGNATGMRRQKSRPKHIALIESLWAGKQFLHSRPKKWLFLGAGTPCQWFAKVVWMALKAGRWKPTHGLYVSCGPCAAPLRSRRGGLMRNPCQWLSALAPSNRFTTHTTDYLTNSRTDQLTNVSID